MGRPGNRILWNAKARGEEAQLIVGGFAVDLGRISGRIQGLHQHQTRTKVALQPLCRTGHGRQWGVLGEQGNAIAQI
jgi:hypothetical protein